jgi:two-component system, LytTR family, response regulator
MLTAYLLDDEALALDRLERLLGEDGRVRVVGRQCDPLAALEEIARAAPDLLFLDIQMPELDGFAVLGKLERQPLVVFATAFDQFALQAFETNSVAYLLKPVDPRKLKAALDKVHRIQGGQESSPDMDGLLRQIAQRLKPLEEAPYPRRVSSKLGDRVEFVDLSLVTHFFAEDKLTYAATAAKNHVVDWTISELESKLDPKQFVRVHRSSIVNVAYVQELYSFFGGKWILRLRDSAKTEVTVAKERARDLRERLGL